MTKTAPLAFVPDCSQNHCLLYEKMSQKRFKIYSYQAYTKMTYFLSFHLCRSQLYVINKVLAYTFCISMKHKGELMDGINFPIPSVFTNFL